PFVVLSSIAFVGTFVLPHVISVVCLKLISHGDAANVPYAQSKLASQSLHVRAAASEALGTIGPRAEAAVNDLIKVLNKDTAFVASQAAWALGEIHADREDAIDALITALRSHKDGEVRRYAAYALSRYGAAGRKAVPALIEALHDPHMAYMAVVSLEAMNAS